MHPLDPSTAAPFVAETLKILREEVGPETAVLGFVGCPYTLATYMIEGKTSKDYINIKKMAFNEPKLLHAILKNLAESIGDYALFQIENGAQLIQIFDSWAGHLSPRDYEEFASPYQKMILDKVRFFFSVCYWLSPFGMYFLLSSSLLLLMFRVFFSYYCILVAAT